MKVLQLGKFYDPVVGGIETVLQEICEQLHTRVQLQVLVANTRFRTEHEVREFPITRVASMGTVFSCPIAPSLPLWVRKSDADLIHVHMPNPLAELSALAADRDTPIVAHFHSDVVRQQRILKLYGPLLRAFYRRTNCIIVPTPRHIDVSSFVSQHRAKCHVVPFGITLSRFDLDEAGRKKVERLRKGRPAILYVGRLVSYKGVEYLLRALEKTDARAWIIGTGTLRGSLVELARKLGINDRVEFLSDISAADLVAYYHACEALVLPSVTNAEMFGMVQLEAMACRKPVISTNLPTGVPWVNQSGTTGLVVSPSNVAELAGAIQRLLANPGLREDMGEAGRRRVEENFTSEKMAAGLLEVYQSVLNHARSERIIRKPVQELRPTVPDIESLRVRRIASKETRT
ncbi:MAG: glycosyltransferase [Candidatus Acidiferrales bacterium]